MIISEGTAVPSRWVQPHGNTDLQVDQQIVYTSEIDLDTGEILEKPMIVTGQLTDELGGNLSNRQIRVTFEMGSMVFDPVENRMKFRAGDDGIEACIPGRPMRTDSSTSTAL